jgi:hypothetical protein
MSIASPPPVVPPSAGAGTAKSGADELIDIRIVEACKALWWAELVRASLRLVITGLGVVLVWVIVDQWIYSPGPTLRIAAFAVLLLSLGWYLWWRVVPLLGSSIRPEYAAMSLERDLPELRQSLTSYVTLRGDRDIAGLRSRVVRSIGAATAGRLRSHHELPIEATGTFHWWIATAVTLALLVAYGAASPKNALQSAARLAVPFASIEPARRVSIRDVQPADTDAIAGRPLHVSAEINGMRDDEEAICSWDLPAGRQQVVLAPASGSGRFSGQLWLPHSASGEVDYVISAGDASAGPFRLRVQDVPVVAVESITYQPPKYSGQTPHTSSSAAITALDLTRVTIQANTNRAVARAVIEFNPRAHGEVVQATAGAKELAIASDGRSMSISFPLRSARGRSAAVELESYRIKVWDSANQSNPEPIIYPIRIVSDLPPDISIMLPVKSPSPVPIDAQQAIEVHASDPDFGLKQVVLEIRSGIDLVGTPILWSDPEGAKGNQVTEYRFRPTEHGLRIGDTVKVIAVARDNRSIENDPSVEANVTRTDPIELKITASQSLPDEADPDAEGLSSPDDRPASDHSSDSQESSDQPNGQEQSGQSGDGQSGSQQSGQGQSGEGQSGEGQSGEGQSGEGQSGEGQSGEGDDASSGQGMQGASPGGEGSSGGDASAESEAAAGQQGGSDQTGSSAAEAPAGGDPSGAGEGPGESTDGTSEGAGSQEPGQPSAGDEGAQGDGDSASDSDGQGSQGASAGGSGDQQEPAESGPPKHDGDAFERIRDYVERMRKEQQSSEGQSAGEDASAGSSSDQQQDSAGGASSNKSNQSSQSNSGNNTDDSSAQSGGQESATDRGAAADGAAADGEGNREAGRQPESADSDSSSGDRGQQSGDGSKGGDSQQSGSGGEKQSQGSAGQDQGDASQEAGSGDSQSAEQSDRSGAEQGDAGSQSQGGQGADSAGAEQGEPGQSPNDQGSGSDSSSAANRQNETADQQEAGNQSSPSGRQTPGRQTPGKPMPGDDSPSSQSPSGGGDGGDGIGQADDSGSSLPPDPVNVEYAKRATDMVLDYLEETRDSPDKDLLDKLNWSEQDLKRFADRWQGMRELPPADQPGGAADSEWTEALKSLGLRPPSEADGNMRDAASSIRRVRDAGNRKPPPAPYRDAFDAFRRAVGRQ